MYELFKFIKIEDTPKTTKQQTVDESYLRVIVTLTVSNSLKTMAYGRTCGVAVTAEAAGRKFNEILITEAHLTSIGKPLFNLLIFF